METKLVKFAKYHYMVDIWNETKMKWELHVAVEKLKDAHETAEYLRIAKGYKSSDIRVSRVCYYDTFSTEDHEYYLTSNTLPNEIEEALELLKEIQAHGYIPWTSPAPSSSECEVKRHIQNAIDSLVFAMMNC